MTTVPKIQLNDGRSIPQFGFGVWQVSTDDIVPAVTKALKVGYRHIDTAAMYGNEEGVGQAITDSGIARDDLFVTTKLNNDAHGFEASQQAAKESITKLGLDYVDLFLIHWPMPANKDYVDTWKGLVELQKQGLARSIGVSNFEPEHLNEIIAATGVTPAVNQVEVHPTFSQKGLVEANEGLGIKTEAWSPLGQSDDIKNDVIAGIADKSEKTAAQVILRWHIQKGHIVFPKSTTPSRIEENFDIFDFELSQDDIDAIDTVNADNRIGPDPMEMN